MRRLLLLLTWLMALPIGMLAQGTTWESATTLDNGSTGRGSLSSTTTEAWYKIVVREEGTVEFTVTPSGNLNIQYITLYRWPGEGEPTFRNDKVVGTDKTVFKVTDVGAGTYYIRLNRWDKEGTYTVNYQFTPCPLGNDAEPNNEWDEGAILKSGETVEGRLGYLDANDFRDNIDWYTIEVPEEGTVEFTVIPNQENELNIQYIQLYRPGEESPAWRTDKVVGKEQAVFRVTNVGAGTYYVRLNRWDGHGGYTLRYEFTPCPLANDPEPNNEWNTLGKDALLESGVTVEGRLGYVDANDFRDVEDWYTIEVPEEGTVEFTVIPDQENALNIQYIGLYRPGEESPAWRTDKVVGKEKAVFRVTNVGAGTYYIRLNRWDGHGGYTMSYEFTPCPLANDPESNDEYTKGSVLESGKTVEGRLGYLDALDFRDVDDWYKIEVSTDGTAEFTVNPDQENALNIQNIGLYRPGDEGPVWRTDMGIGKEEKVFTITDLGKGAYYIRLHRWDGHGGYSLKYEFIPNRYVGDEEPNDTYDLAQPLIKGQKVMAHLGYRDDKDFRDVDDWYTIEVDGAGTVSLTAVPNQQYELNIQYMDLLYEKDGATHSIKYTGVGKVQGSILLNNIDKGTYYVHIHRWDGHGGYTLLYDVEPIRYHDSEPNDDYTQAVTINNGEIKVGNLGFKRDDGTVDEDDWYKVTVEEGCQLLFSYDPDQGEGIDATLTLYYNGNSEAVKVRYNQGGIQENTSAWAHLQSLNIETAENMKGGTYYLRLHRNSGVGTYTMTFCTTRRTFGSDIRVNYIGWPSVRRGVPGSFEVTVQNTGATPSTPFLLCIPYTDDIKLLYADLPDRNGGQHLNVSDMGDEMYHNALLVFPGMNPYEKYTFTVWAEGFVEGKTYARGAIEPAPIPLTILGLMAVNFISDGTNLLTEDNLKKGFANYIKTYVQEEEVITEFERVYGAAEDDIRTNKNAFKQYAQGFTTILENAKGKVNTGLESADKVKEALEYLKTIACPLRSIFMEKYGIVDECTGTLNSVEILDEEIGANNIVASWDPNEMVGPKGYGEENYIGETRSIDYRILFENKAEAGAPAYRIRITDELDPNIFDVESARFGGTSHDDAGYGWKMTRTGNTLSWDIEGIELPPNVNAPEGEGYVTFTVNLKQGLKDGDKIKNKATIIFDWEDEIETNEYVNTLDLNLPTASMTGAYYSGSNVKLKSKGSDAESGISRYKFYAAKGDGEFQLIGESSTTELDYTLPEGEKAEDYKFAVAAVDNVGNTQETLSAAIAATEGAPGDVTGDGEVNGQDIQALINAIVSESTNPKYDVNGDGDINGQDIQAIINIIVTSK